MYAGPLRVCPHGAPIPVERETTGNHSEELTIDRSDKVLPVTTGQSAIHGSKAVCDRPTERGYDPPDKAQSGHRETACFEVHYSECVFGPMTLTQLHDAVAAGTIPDWAAVRRVTPWLPVAYVPLLGVPPGQERHRCIEVRYGPDIRGPVSLDQVRRGVEASMIPEGSEARVVWSWETIDMASRARQTSTANGRVA